jgi:hypothetical protein
MIDVDDVDDDDDDEWSNSPPWRFTSGETAPGIQRIGGWVGFRTGMEAHATASNQTPKLRPSNLWPSRCTDFAIPMPVFMGAQLNWQTLITIS